MIEAMRAQSFDFGGFAPHSYWDLYYGYGLLAVVFALFIALVLWLTSGLAEQPGQVRRFAGCIGVAVAVHAAIIARYSSGYRSNLTSWSSPASLSAWCSRAAPRKRRWSVCRERPRGCALEMGQRRMSADSRSSASNDLVNGSSWAG